MDEKLGEIDRLLNDMKSVLKKYGRHKRVRSNIRGFDLKKELIPIRSRWFSTLGSLFHSLNSQTLYDKIAGDLVRGLSTAKIQYKTDDNIYRAMIECVTIPIIALIMDEQELSKESSKRQERRKGFLHHLIDFKPPKEDTTEDINVVDDLDDHPPTNNSYKVESTLVLGFFIDALDRHSKVVTSRDPDLFAEIYHIINITHIVNVVTKHLENMNCYALQRCAESSQHVWDFETKPKLIEELEKFETTIVSNLESFDVDHPLVIFRHDLSTIKNKLRFLLSTLRRKVDE